jgi:adenylosuccinate lyase
VERNDLMDRLGEDAAFSEVRDDLASLLDPSRYVGRAPEQVDEFLGEHVAPVLERNRDDLGQESEVRV